MPRNVCLWWSLLTLFVLPVAFSVGDDTSSEPPPNLVVIFVDDLGYGDLGCYGHPTIRTPHLDRMAQQGTRFTQFYVAANVCTPSRAGLLTGRYPIRSGMVEGMIPRRVLFPDDTIGLPAEEVTIAEVLKQRNYATKAIGKWHLGHLPEFLPTTQGFDSYFGVPYSNDMDHVRGNDERPAYWNVPLMRDSEIVERPADQNTLTKRYTLEAVEFVREHPENPFFLYLAHTMPHIPLFRSKEFTDISLRGLYGDVVEEIDWSVGQVLEALRESNCAQRTLVLFTSDNGPWLVQNEAGGSAGLLRGGKGSTWEGGMREPMIAWWPGHVPANRVSAELITSLDLLPTAAALANAPLPDRPLDGYNMLPLLEGKEDSPRDTFVYHRGAHSHAIRKGPWKAHFINQTSYPTKDPVHYDPPLLYHLEKDPSEKYNVAENHPEVVAELRQLFEQHVEEIARLPNPFAATKP
ncbi:sulfatase family protein [Bythopirellula goksoeyrii]|uniref:Arylsulfatase n=1 Tax=Bythopirellula goksoeyrii TaxID=1400387 RepID=A0A5B9QCH6_9BACT|nr:sulfatase [Bythopirellula goksoeyrii]QEG36767.1 Arylsulfatase [Bythopirellula goksoeyrii]